MAQASFGVGGTPLRVYVDVGEIDKRSDAFRQARREIGRDTRDGVQAAAERTVLPQAKRNWGSGKVASTLVVRKGTRQSAYITTTLRGKKGRFIGLVEFGGVVSKHIRPKGRKRALVVNGQPVAQIDTPRVYKARDWIGKAVRQRLKAFEQALVADLERALRKWM